MNRALKLAILKKEIELFESRDIERINAYVVHLIFMTSKTGAYPNCIWIQNQITRLNLLVNLLTQQQELEQERI